MLLLCRVPQRGSYEPVYDKYVSRGKSCQHWGACPFRIVHYVMEECQSSGQEQTVPGLSPQRLTEPTRDCQLILARSEGGEFFDRPELMPIGAAFPQVPFVSVRATD